MPPEAARRRLREPEEIDTAVPRRTLRVIEGRPDGYAVDLEPGHMEGGEPGRPTILIEGRPGDRGRRPSRGRSSPTRTTAPIAGRPDRIAMWAVLLGLFLVLMAAATARAAVPL